MPLVWPCLALSLGIGVAGAGGEHGWRLAALEAKIEALEARVGGANAVADPAADGRGSDRRLQQSSCADFTDRAQRISALCCAPPNSCALGSFPTVCDRACSRALLPFWADCRTHPSLAGRSASVSAQWDALVAQCESGLPEPVAVVGSAGNGNRFPFAPGQGSLYARYISQSHWVDSAYYPLPAVSDFDMAGHWTQNNLGRQFPPSQRGLNVDASSSLTAAHYYNAVVYILLRYLNFSPNDGDYTSWISPADGAQICQPPMEGCGTDLHADPSDQLFPADHRIRPTICCHGTGRLDFSALLNEYTSDAKPCAFANANSVSALEWTGCAERLGITRAVLNAQTPAVQQGLDHMFDQEYGAYATGVTTAGTALKKVPVTGPEQLSCGVGLGEFILAPRVAIALF
eukprot:SAG31_NODE_4202_length_3477_cov_11.648313_5_plen_403_part_00